MFKHSIPNRIKRFAAGLAAFLIMFAAVSPLAVVCAHAADDPPDFTYSLSGEMYQKQLANNNLGEDYFDMYFYYSLVNANPVTVHWDGTEYVFSLPEYNYTTEEDFVGHIPAMTFRGPDFSETSYWEGEYEIIFSGELDGVITGTWYGESTFSYEVYNFEFKLVTASHNVSDGNVFGSYDCDYRYTSTMGDTQEGNRRSQSLSDDEYIEGYDFKRLSGKKSSKEKVEDEEGTDKKKTEVTTIAEKDEGDDNGVTIPAAIVVGIAGTGVAAGGAAIAAKNKKDPPEDEEEEEANASVFRMVVSKDFGDSIKKGAEGVYVLARIEEVFPVSGNVVWRNDLTAMIRCYSGDGHLSVEDYGMDQGGNYKCAFVSAEKDSPHADGQVSFSFAGVGGTFVRNVVFKLAGEPAFRFIEETDDGRWALSNNGGLDVLKGDGRTYRVRFFLENATEKPAFTCTGGEGRFEVSFEDDEDHENTYYALVKNLTEVPEPEENLLDATDVPKESILRWEETTGLTLHALFSDKTKITGDIGIGIWPEGLCVKVRDAEVEDGTVIVECTPKEGYYGDDTDVTKFFVYPFFETAVVTPAEEKVKITLPSESMLKVGKLKTNEYWTKNLLLKFQYEIEYQASDEGRFYFTQKDALYEGKNPYLVTMPLSCTVDGATYEGDIPLRLKGEYLEKMADAERERRNLLRALRLYVEDDKERSEWFYFFKDRLNDTKVSAETYRLMRHQIYALWQANAEAETERWLAWGNTFDSWTTAADWTRWIAVRCFAMVAKKYALIQGGVLAESLADALVQPAAEFVLACVEELTDATINGRDFDIEKTKYWEQISAGGDNIAWSLASGSVKDLYSAAGSSLSMQQRVKKACVYLGLYFGYSVLRNFLTKMRETGEADLPGAIWGAFKDLSTNMLKTAAGKLFERWIKNCPKFCENVGKFVGENLQHNFGEKAAAVMGEIVVSKDFAQKWVEELVGEGIGKTYEATEEWVSQSWAAGKLSTLTVSGTSLQGTEGLFLIFELWKCEGQEAVWCQIDLIAGLAAASTGAMAPFTLLWSYLLGNLTGAPGPVEFSAEKPDITQDDVYNFEKLHKQTEQNITEWVFDNTGLTATTTYINQTASDAGNTVTETIGDVAETLDGLDLSEVERDVVKGGMNGGMEVGRKVMEPVVETLAEAYKDKDTLI